MENVLQPGMVGGGWGVDLKCLSLVLLFLWLIGALMDVILKFSLLFCMKKIVFSVSFPRGSNLWCGKY